MAETKTMSTQDTLLAYSEWLDTQGVVVSRKGDDRSHEQLAREFIAWWEKDDTRAALAGRVLERLASIIRKAGDDITKALGQ